MLYVISLTTYGVMVITIRDLIVPDVWREIALYLAHPRDWISLACTNSDLHAIIATPLSIERVKTQHQETLSCVELIVPKAKRWMISHKKHPGNWKDSNCPNKFEFLLAEQRTFDIYRRVCIIDAHQLQHVPAPYRTPMMHASIIRYNARAYVYVSKQRRTTVLSDLAIDVDPSGLAIAHVPKEQKSDARCILSLNKSMGTSLSYMPQTPQRCRLALQLSNSKEWMNIHAHQQTDEIMAFVIRLGNKLTLKGAKRNRRSALCKKLMDLTDGDILHVPICPDEMNSEMYRRDLLRDSAGLLFSKFHTIDRTPRMAALALKISKHRFHPHLPTLFPLLVDVYANPKGPPLSPLEYAFLYDLNWNDRILDRESIDYPRWPNAYVSSWEPTTSITEIGYLWQDEDKDMANQILSKHGRLLAVFPVHARTLSLCYVAYTQDSHAHSNISQVNTQKIKDWISELTIKTIRKDGLQLKRVPDYDQTVSLCVDAVWQNENAWQHVCRRLRPAVHTAFMVHKTALSVRVDGLMLEHIPHWQQTLTLCVDAVWQNVEAIKFVALSLHTSVHQRMEERFNILKTRVALKLSIENVDFNKH